MTYQKYIIEDEQRAAVLSNQGLSMNIHYLRHFEFLKELSLRVNQSLHRQEQVDER